MTKIQDVIDSEIDRALYKTGDLPEVIYLHPKTLAEFVHEMQGWLTHVNLPPKCPHCGKSLLTYRGVRIEELPEGVVMVK